MQIAIIGTGNIGSGLASVLGRTAHDVTAGDRSDGRTAAEKLTGEGTRVSAAKIGGAVVDADVVILATPFGALKSIAQKADFAGKTVIDVSNPVTEDFSALSVGHTTSAAEEIAAALPGAVVVKALNTVFAEHYASGLGAGGQPIQTFVASDDDAARAAVICLAGEIRLEGVDAGPLSNARYLEPLGFMNITFGYMSGRGTGIAPVWRSN
ncbi:NAD(P)-binding domain-containing protein [Rhodobacteraceae bacterium DSL-40]|uniref:NADPH-dependent F420 reductase n=1 Tax=Amaricoccus sp. B4 TaxID=3368557 RepID=UPI000DAB40F1